MLVVKLEQFPHALWFCCHFVLWQHSACDEVWITAWLPLKFSPEETLPLQDGDMQTTPFLLHI